MKVKIKRCFMVFLMTMGMLLSAMTASAYQSEGGQVIEEISLREDGISAVGEAMENGNLDANGVVIERTAATDGMADAESGVASEENIATGESPDVESGPVAGEDTEDSQTVGTVQNSRTGETPFSIPGNGLLLDDKSEDGTKQFLTIRTKNGNTFFMVLDRSNNTENVYMLSMIDENDLAEFIEDATDQPKATAPSLVIPQKEATVADSESTEKTGQVQTEQEQNKTTGMNTGMVFVLIIILAGGIGGFYYLKVIKPKREEEDSEVEDLEFMDDGPYINEDEDLEEDDEDEEGL